VIRFAAVHIAVGDDAVGSDPFQGFLANFLGIRREYQALARAPAPRVTASLRADMILTMTVISTGMCQELFDLNLELYSRKRNM
jgi:hypothetical protein